MEALKSGAKIPKLIKENPLAAATISKLNSSKELKNVDPLSLNIPAIAMSTKDRIRNNEDIVQLFPDTELCIQILTSSVLCPNDILTTSLVYDLPELHLPSELKQTILSSISEYISKNYSLEDKLSTILREALFTKGSYIEAIIPESSLDDVIHQRVNGVRDMDNMVSNIGKEEYTKPKNLFLGNDDNKVNVGIEEFTIKAIQDDTYTNNNIKNKIIEITESDLGIEISEDLSLFNTGKKKLKDIHRTVSNEIYGRTLGKENIEELDKLFKQSELYNILEGLQIPTKTEASRLTLGKPLVMKLPVESIIPVHVVNNPSKHLGYFILLDKYGAPVDANADFSNGGDLSMNMHKDMDTKLNLINKANTALMGILKEDPVLDNIEDVYNKLVEDMIKNKLSKGLYGDLVDIKDNADIYRVMFHRALRSMETKLVFIPAEMVMFYAFDYRDNGTGKSLLEKAALLYSIRSILLFAKLMATLKNSVTITNVNVTLDEFIPDPQGAMEKIISEVLKTRQTQLPVGVTKVNDLVDWTHKVGYRFNFKHPGLPDMDITTDESGSNKIIPDEELDLKIRENIVMSFGLTPEIVDSGYSSDFATTVIAKNLLFAKRVTNIQNIFTPMVSEHIRKLIYNDAGAIGIITSIIEKNTTTIKNMYKKLDNKDVDEYTEDESKLSTVKDNELSEYLANRIVSEIQVRLPKPELNEADAMKQSFENYKQSLTDYIEEILSSECLPEELAGELGTKLDVLKPILKNVILRKWMVDNKYFPELSDFLTKDDEGNPVFSALDDYLVFVNNLNDALVPFFKKGYKNKNKISTKLSKALEVPEENNNESEGEDYGNNEDTSDGEGTGPGVDGGAGFGGEYTNNDDTGSDTEETGDTETRDEQQDNDNYDENKNDDGTAYNSEDITTENDANETDSTNEDNTDVGEDTSEDREEGKPDTDTDELDSTSEEDGEFGMPSEDDNKEEDTAKSEAEERKEYAKLKKAEADARRAEAEAKRSEAISKIEEAKAEKERKKAGIKSDLKEDIEKDREKTEKEYEENKKKDEEANTPDNDEGTEATSNQEDKPAVEERSTRKTWNFEDFS